MEQYNQFTKGTIVKIIKNTTHDLKGEYTGFISEIISPPKNLGHCWCFTLLYGNPVRKEYSEMNFYHDPSALVLASEHEIRLYKAMKCMAHNLMDRAIVPLKSNRKGGMPDTEAFNAGYCLYNLYEDGIYVPGRCPLDIIKIYDISTGKFAYGVPEDNVSCFKKNLGYIIETKKTLKPSDVLKMWNDKAAAWRGSYVNLDLETETLDMFALNKKRQDVAKYGTNLHERIEHDMIVLNTILLLDVRHK